jgi:hypothetical protein
MADHTREELDTFKDELFGAGTTVIMPRAFLAMVKNMTSHATHRLGVVHSKTERQVYWIDGRTLGVLTCLGAAERDDAATDDALEVTGRIFNLDLLPDVRLQLNIKYSGYGGKSGWGRKLTINGPDNYELNLDASPNIRDAVRLEPFIDHVLDALARRSD